MKSSLKFFLTVSYIFKTSYSNKKNNSNKTQIRQVVDVSIVIKKFLVKQFAKAIV